ncbi:MAG: hyperosmotically inducible periplasmic protein, partial [Verrucomicrobiota bacterium]
VPPTALHYDPAHKLFRLDTTKDALASAPHFKNSEWPRLDDADYAQKVYRAHNVEPYFTADVDNTARNVRDRKSATLTPIDQGTSAADMDTTRRIRKEIVGQDGLSVYARNVKVITLNGRVTLRGPVHTEEEKARISDIANRIARSENVDNQLEVKRDANAK